MPPEPTLPCAPEEASVSPDRSTHATAPASAPPTPALTEIASAVAGSASLACTLTVPTACSEPTLTSPIVASSSPLTSTVATEAPPAMPPIETCGVSAESVRSAVPVTNTPPPACGIEAPSSTCASCTSES